LLWDQHHRGRNEFVPTIECLSGPRLSTLDTRLLHSPPWVTTPTFSSAEQHAWLADQPNRGRNEFDASPERLPRLALNSRLSTLDAQLSIVRVQIAPQGLKKIARGKSRRVQRATTPPRVGPQRFPRPSAPHCQRTNLTEAETGSCLQSNTFLALDSRPWTLDSCIRHPG
jgi:hypothetical protein